MTERQKFCLERREKYPQKVEILSEVPTYVILGEFVHVARGVIFAPFGFGYEKIGDEHLLIPHTGTIVIEDNVIIHEGTIIVRGTVGTTIIGRGTKIDTNCHIAHNVRVGSNCLIISGSIIGGSVEIGSNVYVGMGAMIKNKIKIGANAVIGMGAVVIEDVPPNTTVVGNPAKKIRSPKKIISLQHRKNNLKNIKLWLFKFFGMRILK